MSGYRLRKKIKAKMTNMFNLSDCRMWMPEIKMMDLGVETTLDIGVK